MLAKRTWQLGSTTKALKFEGVVRLKGCVLEDVAGEGLPLGFRFYYGRGDNRKFLTLLVTTLEEKADWMRDVTNCIAEKMAVTPPGADVSAAPSGQPALPGGEIKPVSAVPALSGLLMKMEGSFLKVRVCLLDRRTLLFVLILCARRGRKDGSTLPLVEYFILTRIRPTTRETHHLIARISLAVFS